MGTDALLYEYAMKTLNGFYNRTAEIRRTAGERKEDSNTLASG